MKKFLSEFREFALEGNVLDLAVGVIIGGAFQGLVNSLVKDVISPMIGLVAKQDFKDLVLEIWGVKIFYGSFITAVINFVIMAFVIFLLVKGINMLVGIGKNKLISKEEEEETTKECPFCCTEVSINATRCPHCTSIIDETVDRA